MEENSDVHMETDVSSTTDDVVDTQEVTGSNGQLEMTITVEKVKEEEATSNMENDAQTVTVNDASSGSQAREKSPQNKLEPQTKVVPKSPNKSTEVSKPIQKSPAKTESLQRVTSIVSPVKSTVQTSSTAAKAESADSSTKMDSLTSPSKDINCSIDKSSDKDHVVQSTASLQSITKPIQIVIKSPIKESTERSPVKVSGKQKVEPSFLILKASPAKDTPVEKSPVKEAVEHKISFVIQRSPIKLVRKQPNKELNLHETTVKESEMQNTSIKESDLLDKTKESGMHDITVKQSELHDRTIKEKSQSLANSSKDNTASEATDVNGKPSHKPSQNEVFPESESQPDTVASAGVPMDVIEAEASNDSQLSSTTSEKEHNRSISRELKSLINSAKESKIISECTQLTSKTRKSRTNLDVSHTSVETETIQDKNDSQPNESDKPHLKRSMRSQNPDFVTKCKQFLSSVTSKVRKDSDETQSESEWVDKKPESKIGSTESATTSSKKKKVEGTVVESNSNKLRSDPYCWRCHWQLAAEPNEKQPVHPPMHCTVCVRSYHTKCMTVVERKVSLKNWVCPDCLQILYAESSETRSPAMKKISLGMLCDMLKYALDRMEALNGVELFLKPVDRSEFPDYDKIVVHPMDLSQMRQNIADGHYGSTEAFVADAHWILHNSILFNACEQTFTHSKLTTAARTLARTCRAEMAEIETCPECYAGAHSRNLTYFTEVCSTPHMLLWAKLKGFPYWPAKAVAVNNGMVDVRFFGQHDKSWVPVRDCYLYSEKDPNTTKSKKLELMQCRQEAEVHIRNICRKYGSFVYAPFKTAFDHTKMTEQLKMMIPSFDGEIKAGSDNKASPVAKDSRSTSKSSKSSSNDGDISDGDQSTKSSSSSQKTVADDDIATTKDATKDKQESDTSITEKDKKMEIDVSQATEPATSSRKRRRSAYPDSATEGTAQKKKKLDDKPEDKNDKAGTSKKVSENVKTSDAEVSEISKKAEKTKEVTQNTEKTQEKHKPNSSVEKEVLRVTPIKLVALPRANKQTPKIFTTANVTKSTPGTPTTPGTPVEEDKSMDTSNSKRSKVTKADKFIISEQKDFKVDSSRRYSRNNKSLNSTPNQEKTDKRPDKKSDSSSDASTSKEKPKKKDETDRSLLKKSTVSHKPMKEEKEPNKKSEDDLSLAKIAQENRNLGLPTISNVVSLSTTTGKTSTTNTKTTTPNTKTTTPNTKTTTPNTKTTTPVTKTNAPIKTAPKTIEITIDANTHSSVFTPTSTSNVGNMKEAASKLQKLRNTTPAESFVGRVGVKAFARMTSPDINDDVQVEIKSEPIDIEEIDEERQMEKMDLMNACKLQPVNQAQSLRDIRINKVIVTPSIVIKKPGVKATEPRPRAKKTFPQAKRPEGSELNGKNSMVYIPIQPPNTQPPMKPMKAGSTQHLPIPMSVTAGPRPSAPVVSTYTVNTMTTPLRPISSTLSSPPPLIMPPASTLASGSPVSLAQVSNIGQVPTVGPTTVHTVPLMTSVNGQWMFSLQPVMSVGGDSTAPPMLNGMTGSGTLVPIANKSGVSTATILSPITNRSRLNTNTSPAVNDNGTPEMPRLLQRPLLSPFDTNTPIGNLPPPSTSGPLTAKLNQNAVKLTDFFRTLLEDSIEKLDEPLAHAAALKIQLEQARWRHQQNIDELKHNHELTLSEMRQSFEKEKLRIVSEARRAAQVELEAAVKLTKSKQWCSNCHQEAQFYCCWNTSYCDYTCQRAHWNTHFSHCTQEQSLNANSIDSDAPESRLQQADKPPKSVPAQTPGLTTIGGKPAPMRVFSDTAANQKTSIIVSMSEDTSGNQTIKCVGTYKAPAPAATQISPHIINKQPASDDSGAAKKTVTSGGYFIVGASGNTSSVITPAAARRAHLQYLS